MCGIHHHIGGNAGAPSSCTLTDHANYKLSRKKCTCDMPSSQSAVGDEYIAPQTRTRIRMRKAREKDGVHITRGDLDEQYGHQSDCRVN